MRLTLWQQFSSNHSATYTVVGMFSTASDAQRAADELRTILRTIEQWWAIIPANQFMAWHKHVESGQMTPVEKSLAKQYQIKWEHGTNWFSWASWDREKLPVDAFEEFVFVRNPHWYLWFGPQPFDQLLNVMGAEVNVAADKCRTYPDTVLLIDLTCSLPDESSAQALYERFNRAFKAMLAEIQDDYEHYDFEAVKTLGFQLNYDHIDDPFEPPERVYEVELVGSELRLYGLNIVEEYGFPEALVHFLEFLRGLGCTDIQYRFHSALVRRKRYSESDE